MLSVSFSVISSCDTFRRNSDPVQVSGQFFRDVGLSSGRESHHHYHGGGVGELRHRGWNTHTHTPVKTPEDVLIYTEVWFTLRVFKTTNLGWITCCIQCKIEVLGVVFKAKYIDTTFPIRDIQQLVSLAQTLLAEEHLNALAAVIHVAPPGQQRGVSNDDFKH